MHDIQPATGAEILEAARSTRHLLRSVATRAQDVEDLVQEVALRVWRAIQNGNRPLKLRAYMRTVAWTLLVERLRGRTGPRGDLPSLVGAHPCGATPEPVDHVSRELRAVRCRAALRRLPQPIADRLVDHYGHGVPHRTDAMKQRVLRDRAAFIREFVTTEEGTA